MSENILAIDIGGTSVKMGVVNEYNILEFVSIKNIWKGKQNKLIPSISKTIDKWLLQYPDINKIGIGCPGDIKEGVVLKASNLEWENFEIVKLLKQKYSGFDIKIENDGRAATLAELHHGKLKDVNTGLFVVFGRGVGGSIIINNQIYKGANDLGGKFGHMVIKSGPKARNCNCGRKGCFESYCSIAGLIQTIKDTNYRSENREPLKNLGGLRVYELSSNNHPTVLKAIENWNYDIAESLLSLVLIIDPTDIVLAGGVTESGLVNVEIIKKVFAEQRYDKINIQISDFKGKAGLVGAATLHQI